jgi:DNA-binding NarL/FixJ family response regulator
VRARLVSVAATIDTISKSVHRLGIELQPTVLDYLGLSAAIEWQLQDLHQRTGLIYTLKLSEADVRLAPARATAVFRTFQEVLTHIVRYGKAKHIAVELRQQPIAMHLEVSDSGEGMAQGQLTEHASSALRGIRERAYLWGGDVTMQGQPGGGTIVRVDLLYGASAAEASAKPEMAGKIRVLLVDDHAAVRAGVKRFLSETTDLVVTGEAQESQEVFAAVESGVCDVILLDISLPGRDGFDILKGLKQYHPTIPVLVFSVYDGDQYAMRAFRAGAAGYLCKDSDPETLLAALRKVAPGGYYLSPHVAERLVTAISTETDQSLHTMLTDREYQVLRMLAEGKALKHIADELALSPKTVSTYRRRMLKKMHLRSNAELIRYALDHQLIL